MEKYIRIAVLIYITLFTCVVLRWTSERGLNNIEKRVNEAIRFQTYSGRRSFATTRRSGIRSTKTAKRRILKRSLSWQWNNKKDNALASKAILGETSCEGNFVGYDHKFAKLTNVVIDPDKGKGRRGGENCSEVFNQPEKSEYYDLSFGYFKLSCVDKKVYTFNAKSHLSHWQEVLKTTDQISKPNAMNQFWTIAVVRYEYANLYHTMTDFYNAFLVAMLFKMQPGNITILWIDGHPSGALDETWVTLFGNVLRAGDIKKPEMFKHMVWGIMGYDSLLNHHDIKNVPYLEEFRSFFLSRHGVPTNSELKCSNLTIMFLWRRDYLAHPRNPSGSVSRKIKNENELLESAKKSFRNHNVFGIQIDKLGMKEQLQVIVDTDILIGMHGAGLTHTLFLPKHAGLIELYPTYWSSANRHFVSMAMWRKLRYLSWSNVDETKELPNHYTVIDVKVVTDLIVEMEQKICQ